MNSLEINYERAAAEAINKVKQDLATKEIEQRLEQEIKRQKLNETLSGLSIRKKEMMRLSRPKRRLCVFSDQGNNQQMFRHSSGKFLNFLEHH